MAQKHNISCIEKPMTVGTRLQGPQKRFRRLRFPSFPASIWEEKNPLLQKGEIGHEVDTGKLKIGDGITYWNDLPYSLTEWGNIVGDINDQTDLKNALDGKVDKTTTASQVYGTDANGDQTTYNTTDLSAVDDVKVNNVSVVTNRVADIDLTSYLQNTATATDAITVNGIANTSWVDGINIGKDSRINSNNGVAIGVDASADVNAVGIGRDADAGVRGTAIGAYAKTSADTGIAIGCWNSVMHNAVSSAKGAYQFGVGTNNTARTLNVGWYNDSVTPSTFVNYQLLDGNTGLIPDARISTNIARTADIPTKISDLTNDSNFANTDLSNLTSTGANIANWSSNVTNCITEIPQDIKLELNNGTLTLKAGSKIYVPNGVGVFNEVIISTDLTRTTNVGGIVFVNSTGTGVYTENLNSVYSGDSAPSSGGLWYDTTSNLVKFSTDGQTWSGQYSLPIGIVSTSGGQITSIDQVFNGFGYIGSTIFALPGVKGLVPNGRNADGTLKNISWTSSSVIRRTYSSAYSGEYDIFFYSSSFGALKGTYTYDEESNYNMDSNNRYNSTYVGKASITSGVISNFKTKTAFHALDYSDTEYMAHQAMPSEKRSYLTLPASGGTLTMPADGYLSISKMSDSTGQYLVLNNSTKALRVSAYPASGAYANAVLPVSKGDVVTIQYNLGGTTAYCAFIYANGAK